MSKWFTPSDNLTPKSDEAYNEDKEDKLTEQNEALPATEPAVTPDAQEPEPAAPENTGTVPEEAQVWLDKVDARSDMDRAGWSMVVKKLKEIRFRELRKGNSESAEALKVAIQERSKRFKA